MNEAESPAPKPSIGSDVSHDPGSEGELETTDGDETFG